MTVAELQNQLNVCLETEAIQLTDTVLFHNGKFHQIDRLLAPAVIFDFDKDVPIERAVFSQLLFQRGE